MIVLGGATAPLARAEPPPSLRLVRADPSATLHRFGGRVELRLPVYVGSVGGDFQIDVRRPDYGEWALSQVDSATGEVLRALPSGYRGERVGLSRFLRVTLRDSTGALVARRQLDFCPGLGERQRLDDSGPRVSRYPHSCEEDFPFLRGNVWGIDRGWASAALAAGGWVHVPAGEYSATVAVRRTYVSAFGIAPADARKTVGVTVESRSGPRPIDRTKQASRDEAAAAAGRAAPLAAPDPATLPNLVALPAWHIQIERGISRDLLTFASTAWNAGPAPLDVEGFRREGEDVMDAYQYFFDASGAVVGSAPVGTLEFDTRPGHDHWHFEQFARYRLLDDAQQVVVRSHKQSFCIVPSNAIDLTVPGAEWQPGSFGEGGDGSVCGDRDALWIREALDAGWGDTYFQSVAGQAFDITGLPNGIYYVEVRVNPTGELYETSTADDVEMRQVTLGGVPGDRTVRVKAWNGIQA